MLVFLMTQLILFQVMICGLNCLVYIRTDFQGKEFIFFFEKNGNFLEKNGNIYEKHVQVIHIYYFSSKQ